MESKLELMAASRAAAICAAPAWREDSADFVRALRVWLRPTSVTVIPGISDRARNNASIFVCKLNPPDVRLALSLGWREKGFFILNSLYHVAKVFQSNLRRDCTRNCLLWKLVEAIDIEVCREWDQICFDISLCQFEKSAIVLHGLDNLCDFLYK